MLTQLELLSKLPDVPSATPLPDDLEQAAVEQVACFGFRTAITSALSGSGPATEPTNSSRSSTCCPMSAQSCAPTSAGQLEKGSGVRVPPAAAGVSPAFGCSLHQNTPLPPRMSAPHVGSYGVRAFSK